MAASKFTPANRGAILERIGAGCTHDEAARATEINPNTLRNWLRKGRKADAGEYHDFELEVVAAREAAEARPEAITEAELWLEVSAMVRNGSVSAAKLAHEMFEAKRRRDGDGEGEAETDPLADLDSPAPVADLEAARKRKAKGAGK